MEGAWAFGGSVIVALVTLGGNIIVNKRDKIDSRLKKIEESQVVIKAKVDIGNQGTMTSLKIQLQQTYEKQWNKVCKCDDRWSPELDQVFREAYVIYKNLGGNGIIDRLKKDMDIWRDKYASEAFVAGEQSVNT